MSSPSDFRLTWLWRHAFVNPLPDVTPAEQEFFRERYLAMREKAAVLVSQIASAMPGLTVHDLTHLDALWETASLVSEGAITVSPAEAFVFGASVLLHDSAMSLAAYPQGLDQLKQTIAWKDTVMALLGDCEHGPDAVSAPPRDIVQRAVPEVLRQLHAQQAGALAKQGWVTANGDTVYLIDDAELRFFYGETIGQIAHSHWWSVAHVEEELSEDLGAFPSKTKSRIDRVKLACLLRIADALHLDQRRAPRFLRALTHPQGVSALHWAFQERLAVPHIEHEAVVFTAGAPFEISDADAWWLAYDTISAVNRELQDVDLLMQNRAQGLFFRARRVKGAGSPESLARTIHTRGWRPIDTQLRVSDIPKVVETLGGAKLYGDDPTIVLRELIQNSADAVQARRRYQGRRESWGSIVVSLSERSDGHWLTVEDNGIGMSERVLTGPLIDFGTSFWRSTLATQEFPGLIAKGMNAIGRYGIGFFSVFMLGTVVRVVSRRCDQGEECARVLEFRDGTASRPILSPAEKGCAPVDGGTRVEVRLKVDPRAKGGLLHVNRFGETVLTLHQLVASLAPSVAVSVEVEENGASVPAIGPGDWLELADDALLSRLDPLAKSDAHDRERKSGHHAAIRTVFGESGQPLGRAYIKPSEYSRSDRGWITIGGLRAARLANVQGLLVGETVTASRNSALPLVPQERLAEWATEQARIIAASKADELLKAKCAEIVLECCGRLEGLPIVCWGRDEWLNADEFCERLASSTELTVCFDGHFSYDEDEDDVHPRDFRNEFEIGADIVVVPKHDGSILTVGRQAWPRSITGQPARRDSNLAAEVRRLLAQVWGDEVEEDSENREVGKVSGTSITRHVTIYRRVADSVGDE
ncbi:HD domain-containing protein [Acidovorax sp. BoFeN1]|uniref:HD domain-containing protein n=1 Tax=Acidovorax sp. BoFeN1 TaxID=1231053 RepID=UPI001F1890A3|nr:ATP-binding protein [Acidovorax sp. BoFeN1]